ncbi:MAG: tRNA (N(6)-L-threonylcarbamoyladenosine(37)-C(2))-methylthiotransferase MtaB [Clostridia bacterium]|nr:tRNA (N(6)-L-threonylcarbamoyladenosine(37)-C(2))-methylthiotransferase MtaB [Clostridia bacterium]
MKAAFYTLGCKVNQYESEAMAEQLMKNNFEIVSHTEEADVFIVNSCTVTASSDQKTRQAVRRFKKNNPDACVVLTGCMPQAYPENSESLVEADIVIGNKNNDTLIRVLNEFFAKKERLVNIELHKNGDPFRGTLISDFQNRTRAFLKIQDGCNRFCTYCIIPTSRGRSRSKPLEDIRKELDSIAEKGYKEVVLVGINLSSYGKDIGEKFTDAVKLACNTKGIERVRLGSLEPDHITDEVIEELSKLDNFCPQFHISLQSGCNNTLKRMNRHYIAEEYYELCEKLRSTFEDATITTDIMVGFSLESEEDFEESLEFAKKIAFEKVHVFPYSVRKGTKAEKLPQLEKKVKEERAKKMTAVCEEIRQKYLKNQVGKTLEVLIETTNKDGYYEGYTKNYTPVLVKCPEDNCSEIIKVKITAVDGDYCIGELC